MFRVLKEIEFSYAHRLIHYEGKCARVHGHNARVIIEVSSERLNAQGMVMDFYEIREAAESWIDKVLDHRLILCEEDPLVPLLKGCGEPFVTMKTNPTAEALAKWIFEEVRHQRIPVSRVTLWETTHCCAVYHE